MWAGWQNGHKVIVCVLTLRKLRGLSGIVYGLPVDFQWPINTYLRMVVFEVERG